MAIGPVVTRGYGSFGTVNLVVTRGYGIGVQVVATPLSCGRYMRVPGDEDVLRRTAGSESVLTRVQAAEQTLVRVADTRCPVP